MINIDKLRQALGAVQPEEVAELLDRLEAAEKERDALRTKVDAMERQEPVAKVTRNAAGQIRLEDAQGNAFDLFENLGATLYALPVAQPASSVPELLESLRCACNYSDKLGGVSQQYRAVLAAPEAKP